MEIKIYTDGSSRGNPGPGGYGAILLSGKHVKEISKGFRKTTNNRMELMAVIAALQTLKRQDLPVFIYSDSQYVVNSIEKKWLDNYSQEEDLLNLLRPYPSEAMVGFTVSPLVNSVKNDSPAVIRKTSPMDQHGNYTLFG